MKLSCSSWLLAGGMAACGLVCADPKGLLDLVLSKFHQASSLLGQEMSLQKFFFF